MSDYTGRGGDELTLSKGEILTVTKRDTGTWNWWMGYDAQGNLGYINTEHVKLTKGIQRILWPNQ